jgi:hypothetical protein
MSKKCRPPLETLFDAALVKPNRKVWNSSVTSVRRKEEGPRSGEESKLMGTVLRWVMNLSAEGVYAKCAFKSLSKPIIDIIAVVLLTVPLTANHFCGSRPG